MTHAVASGYDGGKPPQSALNSGRWPLKNGKNDLMTSFPLRAIASHLTSPNFSTGATGGAKWLLKMRNGNDGLSQ